MKALIAGICLASTSFMVHADFFEGMAAYQQQNYAAAQKEFAKLLPLGNGAAVFNLAIMCYQGQGEPADAVKTAALLALADELGEPRAKALYEKLNSALDSQQQASVKTQLKHYQQQIVISKAQRGWLHATAETTETEPLEVLKRVPPVFSAKALLNGRYGSVSMLSVVDTDGSVMFVDGYESFDRDMFAKGTKSSFLKWQFVPPTQRTIYRMQYNFAYLAEEDQLRNSRLESWKALQQPGLYESAVQGSAQHQFAFGKILQRLESSTEVVFYPDESLAVKQKYPDRMMYQTAKTPQQIDVLIKGGSMLIQVDSKHQIVQTRYPMGLDEVNLIGVSLPNSVGEGWYKLVTRRASTDTVLANFLVDVHFVPLEHSANYWISQAALNGDLTAQRELAMGRSDWRQYLMQEGDPKGLLWSAMYALQAGDTTGAADLLASAKAKGENQADELLSKLAAK